MLGVFNQTLEEVHYTDLKDGQPEKFDSTGGWLGFTDKYWATALIPDQGAAVANTFQHINQNGRDIFQTDYLARDAITAPAGGTATYEDRLFAGAKVVRTINQIQETHKIDRFDLMIDWGWFYFLTKPMFWLLKHIQDIRRQFRRRHSRRHRARQACGLPARQQVLRLDEQDEEAPAGNGEDQGALPRRPDEAAAGDHGALQEGEGLAACRLSAGGRADSDLLRALQGDPHLDRSQACAVLRLDPRSLRARSDDASSISSGSFRGRRRIS